MTHTVVGVFHTRAAAEQARQALLASDFSNDSIQLNAASSQPGGAAAADHEGLIAGIRAFFANLLGNSEHGPYAQHYSEAVRRGAVVVSVEVADPQRVAMATAALSGAGAVDIDDNLAQWRAEGYESDPVGELGGYEAGLPEDSQAPANGMRSGLAAGAGTGVDTAAAFPGAEHDPVRVYPRAGLTPGLPGSLDAFDAQFRDDFRVYYTPEDGAYEEFAPAYRHGYTSAGDERYRNSDWATAEPGIQRDWESRYPGSSWEKFKLAVQHGWEKMTRG